MLLSQNSVNKEEDCYGGVYGRRVFLPPERTSLELPFFYGKVHQIEMWKNNCLLQLHHYGATWRSLQAAPSY